MIPILDKEQSIESLRAQLAQCQKERDSWKDLYEATSSIRKAEFQQMQTLLTAAQARIRELRSALLEINHLWGRNECRSDVFYRMGTLAADAVSRTDNMEALDAFKNQVIEECISVLKHDCNCGCHCDCYSPSTAAFQIRALKKGAT